MANGKVMTNPGRNRGHTKAELEAQLRDANAALRKVHAKVDELYAKAADMNSRAEEEPAFLRLYPYAIALGLLGLGLILFTKLF